MIITTEDTFSRKSKSSVKLTSEISIISSQDESMKPYIFKNPELQMTESDITSTRGRSRKKLINSTKRVPYHPSSTTDRSTFSFHQDGESPSSIEGFKEKKSSLRWISVKNSSSNYCEIESVCNSSKFEPVGDIFENSIAHSNTASETTNCRRNYGKRTLSKKTGKSRPVIKNMTEQPNRCYFKTSEDVMKQTFRDDFMSTVDEEYSGRNFRSTDILATNYEFQKVQKKGREEIIVFNVHCVEKPEKRDMEVMEHSSSYDISYPTETDMKLNNIEQTKCNDDVIFQRTKENEAKAEIYKENLPQLGTQSIKHRSCALKDSWVKKKYFEANTTGACSHHFPIATNSKSNFTSSDLYPDSHYNGCNADCFGTGSSKLFSNKKPHEKNSYSVFNISQTDLLTFPKSNIIETTMNISNTPHSIQNMKTDFCECPFSNFVNIHKKHSHRPQDMQRQIIPDNIHDPHGFHRKFGSRCQCPGQQHSAFKEQETFNENTTDNLLKLTENYLKTTFPANIDTEDKKPINEEIVIDKIPVETRKRHCTLCRTGTVDEGELSLNSTYEDVGKKRDFNPPMIPNADFKYQSIDDDTFLKRDLLNKKESIHKIQNKQPHETLEELELVGSQRDFSVLPNTITKPPKTKAPFQSIQNSKSEFCGCYPYLNYVNVDQKYLHKLHNTHNQGIPHNTNEHRCVHPSIEWHHLPHRTHNYFFGECRCKTDRSSSNEFKEPEKVIVENANEDANEDLPKIIKKTDDTKLPEIDIPAKTSTVNNENNDNEIIDKIKTLEKKKRSCTLCRTGKADEGELSLSSPYEDDVKRKNFNTSKTDLVGPNTKQLIVNRKADEGIENLTYTKPVMATTRSVEFETKKVETVPRTFDIGRNITIQIIPNFASPNARYETQNVLTPRERVTSPSCEFTDDYSLKSTKNENIPQNQIGIHIHKSEENMCNPIHESGSDKQAKCLTRRDQCRKDREYNKWWTCSWRRKKHPYPYCRSPDSRITQDCCTCVDQTSIEPGCQRAIPISDNHKITTMKSCSTKPNCSRNTSNRDENVLKYIQRLNKTIIQDLLATPCPSSSVAHIQTCTHDIKKTPLATCADSPHSYNVRPLTVNQCCQYESNFHSTNMNDCMKGGPTTINENNSLYECLRHLTKKISHIENRLESDDEYENYSHKNINSCCCCCNRSAKCCCYYPKVKTCSRKPNNKVECPCTQSRSVEVIHSMKHCGTAVSKECLQENAYTNTEVRPKMSKAIIRRKCRHCCRSPCCHCCRPMPCCSCVPESDNEFFDNSQMAGFEYENRIPCCQRDHITYNCQCEHQIQICQSQFELKRNNYVIMETKNTSTSQYQSVKSCQCNEAKSEVKSTNTTEHAPITNDELMKRVTLDLCNLGEKTLSKFGVPSRHYHWSSNNFSPNMPNEIYRFIRTESYHIPKTEQIYDPTPCLRPEILSINHTKNVSQNIELIQMANESDLPDASGDIKEESSDKKKKLSTICEGTFGSTETEDDTFHNKMISVDLGSTPNIQLKFSSEPSFDKCSSKLLNKKESFCADTNVFHQMGNLDIKKDYGDIYVDDGKNKSDKFEDDIVLQQKINIKSDKSRAKITNKRIIDSIQLKKDQKIKTVVSIGNSSTYMPKPFTTKTGLMSYIPPFRDSFRSCTQVNRPKEKLPVGSLSRTNIKKNTTQKPRTTTNIVDQKNSKRVTGDEKFQKEKEYLQPTNEIEFVEEDYLTNAIESESGKPEGRIIENLSNTDLNSQDQLTQNQVIKTVYNSDYIVGKKTNSEKNTKFSEKQIDSNTLQIETFEQHTKNEQTKIVSPMKFDEIYSFYDKCCKPSNNPKTVMSVPYFKTNVADIIKSLEFRRSSTTKSFLHSLVGSVVNSENQSDASFKNFLFDENIRTKNLVDNTPIYEQFFKESPYQNAVQIPRKILSKTDLISLK